MSACLEPERERPRVPGVVPVNDDRAALADPLLVDLTSNLRLVEAVQPRVRERHRAGHVAAAALVVESPAVVRRGRADVDDRHVGLVEEPAEVSPVDGAQPVRLALMNAHRFVFPVLTVGLQKTKAPAEQGCSELERRTYVCRTLRCTTCSAWHRSNTARDCGWAWSRSFGQHPAIHRPGPSTGKSVAAGPWMAVEATSALDDDRPVHVGVDVTDEEVLARILGRHLDLERLALVDGIAGRRSGLHPPRCRPIRYAAPSRCW